MQRRRPWQRYCSTTCRMRAFWRRRLAPDGGTPVKMAASGGSGLRASSNRLVGNQRSFLGAPEQAFWGGGFSWRDPEGNIWDVAWAEGSTIDDRGGLTFP